MTSWIVEVKQNLSLEFGKMSVNPEIVVVLPAYNEAQSLPGLFERFAQMNWGKDTIRIILVDDGSTDGTAKVAQKVALGLPIETLTHSENRGLGQALNTGLMRAIECCAADGVIVTLDADDTHLPDDIPALVAACRSSADMAIASRYLAGADVRGISWYRRLLSRGASTLFRLRYHIAGVTDYTSGFRAYRASLLVRVCQDQTGHLIDVTGFECQLVMLLRLAYQRVVVREVPIHLRYDRKRGPSKLDAFSTIVKSLRLLVRR